MPGLQGIGVLRSIHAADCIAVGAFKSAATRMKPMLALDAAKLRKPDEDPAGIPAALRFPLVGQEKLDGIRVVVKDGVALTRTLKPLPNAEIQGVLGRGDFEGLDGEIIVGDPTDEDCYRNTASFAMSESKAGANWSFNVFDKWDQDGSFWVRYGEAEKIVLRQGYTGLPIFMVPSRTIETAEGLVQFELDLLAVGHEGVILRDESQPYKFGRGGKRDQSLVKLKRYIDFEAEVIGVYEEMHNANEAKTNALGRTERSTAQAGKVGKGTLGGLYLRALNGPCKGIEFKCGTGFDAAMRADLWAVWHDSNLRTFKGDVAKIKSFPIGVKEKPRHPVFLGWRDMELDGAL